MPFLDTNIILRLVLNDHIDHSPRAKIYFDHIEKGEIKVRISGTVVFETIFTLQTLYKKPRTAIRDAILPLIELAGVILPGKRKFRKVFDYYVDLNISFADAYYAVLAEELKDRQIVSFDKRIDRVNSIKRIEP